MNGKRREMKPVGTLRAALVLAFVTASGIAACAGGDGSSQDSAGLPAADARAGAALHDPAASAPPSGSSQQPVVPTATRPTILFVGTSLTAGLGLDAEQAYPALVQEKIDSAGLNYDVVNAGVSGETSSALLRRITWLLRQPFEIIVLETGANDGLRGIPVDAMRRNIQQVIDSVKTHRPDAQVLLVQMEAPPNLGAGYTTQFRRVFPDLARSNGVKLLPFLLDGVAGVRELNQGDGIHPNPEGSRRVAANVWRGLRPMLK